MRKSLVICSTIFLLGLLGSNAQANTMRCDRDLISRGDTQGEVLLACGEPVFATQKTIYRSGIPNRRFSSFQVGNGYYADITNRELLVHNRSVVEVPMEVWTYNFGPRVFMREVTFVDGKVSNIKTLGYGH